MAAGYDGSIRIDTRMDTKGFNAGVSKLSGAMKGISGALLTGLTRSLQVVGVIGTAIKALIGAAVKLGVAIIAAVFIFSRLFSMLAESVSKTDAFYGTITQLQGAFSNLKGAFLAAFATLLQAALPAIMTVINWLTRLLNVISQVIAALSGQSSYMQYVAGSADAAAGSTGKMAKNTEKTAKAAKGALAAFDQINVLAKQEPDTPDAGGGGAGGGTAKFERVPIDPAITAWVEGLQKSWDNFKKSWNEFWKSPFGQMLSNAWDFVWNMFLFWIDLITGNWAGAWEHLQKAGTAALNVILIAWGIASAWFQKAWENIKLWAGDAWVNIQMFWVMAGRWFKVNVTDPIANWFKTAWDNVKLWASTAWNNIKLAWGAAVTWFTTTVIDPIKKGFDTVLKNIGTAWENTFNGVKDKVRTIINGIIGLMNRMIAGVISGMNGMVRALNGLKFTLPSWIPGLGGSSLSLNIPQLSTPQIPMLATGAVIPPNAQFAAILGDQRNGRNLEAPEGLLRQIVREEISGIGSGDIVCRFEGSMSEVARVMQPHFERENRRIGTSLIAGGAS